MVSRNKMIDYLLDGMNYWTKDALLEWARNVRADMLQHVDTASLEEEYDLQKEEDGPVHPRDIISDKF